MRYTALLLLALLALATCNTSLLTKGFLGVQDSSDTSDTSDTSETSDSSSDQAIEDFLTSFFAAFDLDKPQQVIDCFSGAKSQIAFFSSLYEKYELLKDTTERSQIKAHLDYAKLALIYKALESENACMFISNDFTDLLDALNVTKRDPSKWGTYLYVNYQAHYDDLYEAYQPLIDSLNNHNFTQAGGIYADILNCTINTIRKEGAHLQAFNGFGNGFAVALDLDEPSDSLECYDTNSSAITLEFLYKLSVAVTDGKFYEAPVNTLNFWENEGKAIIEQMPKDVMDCDSQSNDHQQIIQKLGIDNYSEEFGELFKLYINNHRLSYYGYMKGLRSSFEDHNFIHAGDVYGGFISAIAAKKD